MPSPRRRSARFQIQWPPSPSRITCRRHVGCQPAAACEDHHPVVKAVGILDAGAVGEARGPRTRDTRRVFLSHLILGPEGGDDRHLDVTPTLAGVGLAGIHPHHEHQRLLLGLRRRLDRRGHRLLHVLFRHRTDAFTVAAGGVWRD